MDLPPRRVHSLPALTADFGRGKSVVILGGGIAGLVSAYELCKAGFECTILEARSRPGGRNRTVRNGTKVESIDGTVQNCMCLRSQGNRRSLHYAALTAGEFKVQD